jgi:hypothetical protein
VEDAYVVGDHTLFIGKVVATQAEKEAFDQVWLLGDDDRKPLHYIGANCYAILGERLEARVPEAEEQFGELPEETEEEERRRPEGAEGQGQSEDEG